MQDPSSSLSGQVLDPSGALIAHADISLSNSHGEGRQTSSDASGHYTFLALHSDLYSMVVVATGFATYRRGDIRLSGKGILRVDIYLAVAIQQQQINVSEADAEGLSVAPEDNAGAVKMTGEDLDALSDNPDELNSELNAMAGPSPGIGGPEVSIDGFSGASLPPKSSIREIRLNQNPYSAAYDKFGYGRIEIFTKPGTQTFHGGFSVFGNDSAFNSGNPFVGQQPPYYSTTFEGNVDGPIRKSSTFFASVYRGDIETNAVVNAEVLDASLNPAPLLEAISTPQTATGASIRFDHSFGENTNFTLRYQFNQSESLNGGIGQFALASQGVDVDGTNNGIELSVSQIHGAGMVNQLLLQYLKTRNNQHAQDTTPTLTVQGAFTGGGSTTGESEDHRDQWELQDNLSLAMGSHFLHLGGRLRASRYASKQTAGFNGDFVFASLDSYQITEQGIAAGLTEEQIRATGGGASQFTLTGGAPGLKARLGDLSLYAEDNWKVLPNLMFSYGVRFESQPSIHDSTDFGPRIAVAWGINGRHSNVSKTTFRAGYGWFFDRFPESYILQARRQNGTNQQTFIVGQPDFFPVVPSTDSLTAQTAPTLYRLSSRLHAPYLMEAGVSVDRQLSKATTLSLSFIHSSGVHQLLSRNINAPLPGTYDPTDPSSGGRPLGANQNIYEFESEGSLKQNQVIVNLRSRMGSRFSAFGYYMLNDARADTSGPGSFPSNQYDLKVDYGRAVYDVRHRAVIGGFLTLPDHIQISPFLVASSGAPFNIVLGEDLNGDGQFNDRPAFATDLSRPSVIVTKWGNFDTSPIPGQRILPINYGTGPAQFVANLRIGKSVDFGREQTVNDSTSGKRTPGRYVLTFGLTAQNTFNRVNLGQPVGTVTSPLFGKSTSLAGSSSANRRINLQMSFRF